MQNQPVMETGMWLTYIIVIIVPTMTVIVTPIDTVITDAVKIPVTV